MKTRLLSHYTENILYYKEHEITTYVFGKGKKTVFLFPPFPHSGLLYMLFYALCPEFDDIKYVTLDLPGWIGHSPDVFNKKGFNFDVVMEIVKEFINYYSDGDFSILGFSFGSAVAVQVPKLFKDRVKNVVLVSPVVNSHLIHDYPQTKILNYLKKKKYYDASKYYVRMRFKSYAKDLSACGFPLEFIDLYSDLITNIDIKTVMNSAVNLFKVDFSEDIKLLNNYNTMVVNSINESHVFIEQADYLRSILKNEKSEFLVGPHENFLLYPDKRSISKILEFLSK